MSGECSLRVLQGAVVAGATAALLLLSGCGASQPRFRNADQEAEAEEEVRFASRIREEESREDDRKFDPALWKGRAGHILPSREDVTPAGLNRDWLLLEALSFLGVPYSYGGNGKDGIDCSGFTARVYRGGAEILLPRSTAEQFRVGEEVERDSLLFGDLVFFNTTGRAPSHVGIYLEDGLFAHASVTYGVTISSLESTYYRNRFLAGRRVVAGSREAKQ